MRLLLDSHALIWWMHDDDRLSKTARAAVEDGANDVLASAVSAYELALKQRRGLIAGDPTELVDAVRRNGMQWLSIEVEHAHEAALLPGPHRDPWDRLLIAQAKAARLAVVTRDAVFARYGLETIW